MGDDDHIFVQGLVQDIAPVGISVASVRMALVESMTHFVIRHILFVSSLRMSRIPVSFPQLLPSCFASFFGASGFVPLY